MSLCLLNVKSNLHEANAVNCIIYKSQNTVSHGRLFELEDHGLQLCVAGRYLHLLIPRYLSILKVCTYTSHAELILQLISFAIVKVFILPRQWRYKFS